MLSMRQLRIKALHTLYGYFQDEDEGLDWARDAMKASIQTTYDIYLFILQFPQAFHIFLESEKEAELAKYFPNKERIRDCALLRGNHVVLALHEGALHQTKKIFKGSWEEHAEQFKTLFAEIRNLDFVKDYLVFDKPNRVQQVEFINALYHWLIVGCETFNLLLEEIYASWYDDDKMMLKNIQKTVTSLLNNDQAEVIPPLVEGDEDMDFGLNLVSITAKKNKEFENMISDGTQNWDPERIAMLDLIMTKMAMCEFVTFQNIPVKVSINEYLEIAKAYSTPNSAKFINGILDKLRIRLLERKAIVKSGRGLIEN